MQDDLIPRVMRIPVLLFGNHLIINRWYSVLDQMRTAKPLTIQVKDISVVICPSVLSSLSGLDIYLV